MTSATPTTTQAVWPGLFYADAPAAIRFLVDAFGFEEVAAFAGETPDEIVHAELRWPLGGGIMLSTQGGEGDFGGIPAGVGSVYVVTDQPDALFERAMAAGATQVRGLRDEEHGSRGFSVRDPEGYYWSFGTYRGE